MAAAALTAAGLALLYRAVLPGVFESLLGAGLGVREGVTVLLITPLGLLLGVPFPSGVR